MKQKRLSSFPFDKIFFIFACIFTVVVTYYVTQNCIDSDASSELVLAQHLAKTGRILSTDWIYSTELRVFNTQLIYAPLFLIFNSWHMVRFTGALILQAILVLSFFAFTRLLKIESKTFFISASLMLLPISVCFGRIVLYHSYYVPHIALSLLIVGLTFTKKYNVIKLSLLGLLSFIGGLGGVRHLLMTHAPIVFAVFIFWCISDFTAKDKKEAFLLKNWPLISAAVFSAAASAVGFIINTNYLAEKYTFADYSKNTINLLGAEKIKDVLYGFFHHFGFRDEIEIMSVLGVLSVFGILLGIYCLILAIKGIVEFKTEQDILKALPYTFFVAFTAVMLTVFLILDNGYYFVLYFTPLVVWMIPVFVLEMLKKKDTSFFNLKVLLPYLAVAVILVNGIANAMYFTDLRFDQKYEGLKYRNKYRKEEMLAVTEFLEKENYEIGYATFWNANIVTEITDGKVKMIGVTVGEYGGQVERYDWLTLKSNSEIEAEKKFLLLEKSLATVFEANNNIDQCKTVYFDEYFIVYDIP